MPILVTGTVSMFYYYIEVQLCDDWKYVLDDLFDKISKKSCWNRKYYFKEKFNDVYVNMEEYDRVYYEQKQTMWCDQ